MSINESNAVKPKTALQPVREPVVYTTVILLIICTLLVGFSFYWNIKNIHQDKLKHVLSEAKSNWNKDQAFRGWASKHGGLYVKPNARTQPSPYLSHLPNRNVVTTDGMKLTLLNPAFMMRQMTEEYEGSYGIKGKITAKNVLNPVNKADEWQSKALNYFKNGTSEFFEETLINDAPYFRYMKPMSMKQGCMKCHGHLGIKVGAIYGGVSVSIPMKSYISTADSTNQSMLTTHLLILFLGYLGIIAYGWTAKKRERERLNFEVELKQHQKTLEEQVLIRTKELKEKEQEAQENTKRLDQIMDTAAEGIITSDISGTIESFNHAAEDIFGFTAKEVVGKNIDLLIPGSHKNKHDKYIESYVETGESVIVGVGRDVIAQRKNGSIFPASIAISDMQFNKKRIFTAIIHDITHIKQNESDLIKAKEEAEKANLVKSEFLSSMSHDLRTPLNAVLGFGELLKYDPSEALSSNQSGYVEQIIKGGKHLLNLINDILDLAKIEADKVDLFIEELDLYSVLDECIILIQPLSEAYNIKINDNYKNQENKFIQADNTRLKQILLNILSNAIKYNKENGSITIERQVIDKRKLRINIIDTGLGIATDKQADIFTPFFRVDNNDSSIEGTGIGLTLSKKLIKIMNGSIGFVSEINKGSTFWIEIPILEKSKSQQYDIIANDSGEPKKNLVVDKLDGSVLYVEDNPANIRLMEALTENIDGLNLMIAINAYEGIKMAKEKKPDIIILDINLPDMNGVDVFKKLNSLVETSKIPIIALSAAASKSDIQKGLSAGFKYYLTKPMVLNEVISAIKSLLKTNKI